MPRALARDVYILLYLARYQKLQQKRPRLFALEIHFTDIHAKVKRGRSMSTCQHIPMSVKTRTITRHLTRIPTS